MIDDLISRSALLEKAEGGTVCWFDIKHAPAVDVDSEYKHSFEMLAEKYAKIQDKILKGELVEVVLCNDCKHSRERDEHEREYVVEGVVICTHRECPEDNWFATWSDHWCRYGERRSDE